MVRIPVGIRRRSVLKTLASAPVLGSLRWRSGAQATVEVTESPETIRIGNEQISLALSRENGGLRQLRDERTGVELRDATSGYPEVLWSTSFYSDSDEAPLQTESWLSNSPTFDVRRGDTESTVGIRWENPALRDPRRGRLDREFDGTVTVDVTVRAGEPFARFAIDVENRSLELDVEEVACPYLTAIQPLASDGSDAVIIPSRIGRRFVDPTGRGTAPHHRYPSGFGTMQFSAYLGPDGGFYADARDTEGYVKRIVWEPDREAGVLNYKIAHRETMDPGADVIRPYQTTFGVVEGDWYDAADRYRTWLDTEGWLSGATRQYPEWLLELGAIYRIELHPPGDPWDYSVDEGADMVRSVREYLGVPIGFQLGEWEASENGDWLPPRDGWDAFEGALRSLLREGIRSSLLVGAAFYGRSASLFEEHDDATEWIVRARDGSAATVGDAGHYLMEATHDGWQSFLVDTIRKLVDAGVKEVQYDGVPHVLPGCYAEYHDHGPGQGGNWFASKCRPDIVELSALMAEAGQGVLSGEGTCDFYLPYLGVFPTRDVFAEYTEPDVREGAAEIIPLHQYTFGDLQVIRNQNHEPITLAPELDRLFSARALLWGAIPVFRFPRALEDEPPAELRHFRRVARARALYGNRFVARGELLRAPSIDSESVELHGHGDLATSADVVQAGAWASDAGEIGVFLMNIAPAGDERTVRYDPGVQPFPPLAGKTIRYVVRNGTYERVVSSTGAIDVMLARDDVVLIVEAPAGDDRRAALEAIVEAEREVDHPTERGVLAEAKRAFEGADFAMARTHAEEVPVGAPDPESRSSDRPTAEAEADGLGFVAAVTAVGGYLLARSRFADDGEE